MVVNSNNNRISEISRDVVLTFPLTIRCLATIMPTIRNPVSVAGKRKKTLKKKKKNKTLKKKKSIK